MGESRRIVLPSAGRTSSVAWRAALAVLLMVGFYLLAIGIALGLLTLCYVTVAYGQRIPVKLLLIMALSACLILWSIVPRADRFVAPGPRLLPEKHPKLFAALESIAQETGQQMPAEVYLESGVNAWVSQRGGVMGVASRRVMGLGLGLLRVLNVAELRAVLAHEFGHYYGGDTKLGPWVHKTRASIGRTITSLSGNIMQKPFLWYGSMFLRVTHAVSRRQEFMADRLAAMVAGKEALTSGLRKVHGAGMAFTSFWRSELVPVLTAGYRPPIAEGFARFVQCSAVTSAVDKAVDAELRQPKTSPYDTHPPLALRIGAVDDLPARATPADDTPAIALLADLPSLEHQLLIAIGGPESAGKLTAAKWEDVGTAVYVPLWRRVVSDLRSYLAGLTPENLPEKAPGLQARCSSLSSENMQRVTGAVGAALAVAAVQAGAVLECDVGAAIVVAAGEVKVEPFTVLERLAKGQLTAEDWTAQCAALGITGVDLATVGGNSGQVDPALRELSAEMVRK